MLRRHTIHVLCLLAAPTGALGAAAYASWSTGPHGALLSACLAALAGGAAVVAAVFALDAARMRRAFSHLRAGRGALAWIPPQRIQAREQRFHETELRLRRQVEQLSAIRDLALITNDDVSFERVLERALAVLGGLLDAREITIYLLEGAERAPVAVAHRLGDRVRVRGKQPLRLAPKEARRALEVRRTIVDQVPGGGLRAAALLNADGELMGAVEVRLERGGPARDPRELERELEALAKHIALAIRKPTLYDRAVVDGLTKLYTKRHFSEQVQQHMAQRKRLGTPLSLIILDVDHFKSVNDTHGHVAGDLVLIEVARRVKQEIRGYDQAFRYGGEEVVVLAPNTGLEAAVGLAERLRRCLRDVPFDAGEVELSITASFGVAEYCPERMGDAGAVFVEAADQHLYRAKHGGRDQVQSDLTPAAAVAAPREPDPEQAAETTEAAASDPLPVDPPHVHDAPLLADEDGEPELTPKRRAAALSHAG